MPDIMPEPNRSGLVAETLDNRPEALVEVPRLLRRRYGPPEKPVDHNFNPNRPAFVAWLHRYDTDR